jgi:hypothetical protein
MKYRTAHKYDIIIESIDGGIEKHVDVAAGKASLISHLLKGNNFNHIQIIPDKRITPIKLRPNWLNKIITIFSN